MPSQAHRSIAIETPLASDELVFYSAKIKEGLGQPFLINVELFSENDAIALEDLLGQNVTIRLEAESESRYWNGIVTEFTQQESKHGFSVYTAIICPWFWLLKLSENCRIFQEKSYPDIIKEVFEELGFSDFENRLSGSYNPVEYTVQYNESDFNFVSRIMEQEGIYYYFEHVNGKHTMVLVDSSSSMIDLGEVVYFPPDESDNEYSQDTITAWHSHKKVRTAGIRRSDYDFEVPTKNLEAVSSVATTPSLSSIEKFNYPGKYSERADGNTYTRILMERENVSYETKFGQTKNRLLFAGGLFTLADHYRDDQNIEYLITEIDLTLYSDSYISQSEMSEKEICQCHIQTIPSSVVFRAEHQAVKPKLSGPQTAIVVGKKGEEIWTDKYGRIKVLFHWDRLAKADEKSSCWVRVAQTWAGKKWGSMHIPRIGQEVLIEFLHGDPDKPIVVGSVYNGATMPPYDLPANATMSGIKSRTSKGGGGFNEIRFEDKKGDEQIFVHGQKNQDINIKNDCYETIGNDRHLVVKNDQKERVDNNRFEEVKADHVEKIGKDRHLNIIGKEAKKVKSSLSLTVSGDVAEVFKANHSMQVTKDCYVKAKNICIEATENITIKVGKSFIAIDSSGIKMETKGDIVLDASGKLDANAGANLTIDAGANLTAKAGANAKVEAGGMGDFKAGGIASVKGSMVKVN